MHLCFVWCVLVFCVCGVRFYVVGCVCIFGVYLYVLGCVDVFCFGMIDVLVGFIWIFCMYLFFCVHRSCVYFQPEYVVYVQFSYNAKSQDVMLVSKS